MKNYHVKLRYYPGDPREEIVESDLEAIASRHDVRIELTKIDNREPKNGLLMEETLDMALESISQSVISITAESEDALESCIVELYKKYRSPRTVYSFVGSSENGTRVARRLIEECGGW